MQGTPENRLRRQAVNVASLDDQMKVIEVKRVETSDTVTETAITDAFVGPQAKPVHAFLINYDCHGYGKFEIDSLTMKALETGLSKIVESRERKSVVNIMFDQVKSGSLPANRVLRSIINSLEVENAVDVIQDTLKFIVPQVLRNYLHEEAYEGFRTQLYDLVMRIMQSGKWSSDPSCIELLVSSAISFASSKQQHVEILKWFTQGKITGQDGSEIAGTSVNVKLRHDMVRKLFASKHVPLEQAKEIYRTLAGLDDSDMTQRTEWYCNAAVGTVEAKREAFERLFTSVEDDAPKLGLQECQEMCRGFAQYGQRDILEQFADEFLNRIERFMDKASWSHARYVYIFTQPKFTGSDAELSRFETLLRKCEGYTAEQRGEGTDRLIKWIKDSVQSIREMNAGRSLSRQWEMTQPSL